MYLENPCYILFKDIYIYGLLESLLYVVQNDIFANFKSGICHLKQSIPGKLFIVRIRGSLT